MIFKQFFYKNIFVKNASFSSLKSMRVKSVHAENKEESMGTVSAEHSLSSLKFTPYISMFLTFSLSNNFKV